MRKIFTLLCSVMCTTMIFAQSVFVQSPNELNGETVSLQGLAMSQNHLYVVGENMENNTPVIWNTATNAMVNIVVVDQATIETMHGALYAVTNNGLAVGCINTVDGLTHPITATIEQQGSYTLLYEADGDAGSVAYDISADGSTILGFHFDETWTTYACVWTNNGQTRTDLPWPTEEQIGFGVDYASARWISADGSVVLGYVQDENTGSWVAMAWRKSGDAYAPVIFSNNYYQSYSYDDMGEVTMIGEHPYFEFEPMALSENGEWVTLSLVETYDLDDWYYTPVTKGGRYNLNTNTLEVLNSTTAYSEIRLFGVSNDGTAVGRMEGEVNMEQTMDGVLWKAGENDIRTLASLFADDPYITSSPMNSLVDIDAQSNWVMGYAYDENMSQKSFIVRIGNNAGINNVDGSAVEPRMKGVYDLMGRKLDAPQGHGIFIIDGKKVIR